MTYAAAQLAIENRFATNFTSCAIKFQNVPFTVTPGSIFVELNVTDYGSHKAEIGGGLHRSTGLIVAKFNVPKGQGTKTGRALADLAAAVFREKSFSGITCRSPIVQNGGESQEWFQIHMICPFYRDEIYS